MENNFASELLAEVKQQSRRWFWAFCIMVGVEIATIGGFLWYVSLPTDEYEVTQESDDNSNNTFIGGNNYGGETDN